MHHKGWWIVVFIIVLAIIAIAYGVTHVNVSALPEPGPFETSVAMKVKDWYIHRAVEGPLAPPPANDAASISAGGTTFIMGCATCHGKGGRNPTPVGKSMYPRALDLGSPEVQGMPDREIFWVIKNGIRLSGMPGFAHIESDEEIWQLTYYVRSLGKQTKH